MISLVLMWNSIILSTNFFLQLYLDGTSITWKLKTKSIAAFLKESLHVSSSANGIKFLTKFILGLNHLHEYKFRHYFQDSLNPLCDCGKDVEKNDSSLTRCANSFTPRQKMLGKLIEDITYFKRNNRISYINRKIQMSSF